MSASDYSLTVRRLVSEQMIIMTTIGHYVAITFLSCHLIKSYEHMKRLQARRKHSCVCRVVMLPPPVGATSSSLRESLRLRCAHLQQLFPSTTAVHNTGACATYRSIQYLCNKENCPTTQVQWQFTSVRNKLAAIKCEESAHTTGAMHIIYD